MLLIPKANQDRRYVKAAMLTRGCVIRRDELERLDLDEENRRLVAEGSFIHGTVFRLFPNDIVNTSVRMSETVADGEVELVAGQTGTLVALAGGVSARLEFLRQPACLSASLGGSRVGDFFTMHSPTTLFSTPVRQCIFISINQPCTFCTFEGGPVRPLSLDDFTAGVSLIRLSTEGLRAVAVGGGTTHIADGGIGYYAELIAAVSSMGLASSLEIIPPRSLGKFAALKGAGLGALIMNLEVWDTDIRERVCLGKGRITREHYIEAWREALKIFGEGSVSSVLLVGIEPMSSTVAGMKTMVSMGVIPVLIPYRQYSMSLLTGVRPVHWRDYMELETELGQLLVSAGLDPQAQAGCVGCGGCSLANETAAIERGQQT